MRKYLIGFFVLVNVYWFQGCDNPQLKPPRTDGSGQENSSQDENRKIDREFARELAREFGKRFAREFALHMKGNLSHQDMKFVKDKNDTKSMEGEDWRGKVHPLLVSLFGGCFGIL